LYKYDHSEKMPSDLAKSILGKRVADSTKDLEDAVQYEHVRDYSFTHQQLKARNEFVIKLDNSRKQMTFLPILDRIALVKKKKTLEEMQNDGQNPNFLAVAPRSFTQKEITSKIEQSLKDCGTQMKTIEKANHFKDRRDLIEIETNTAEPALQRLFKSRIEHNEEVFKAANDGDDAVPRAKTAKDEDMRYDKDEDDVGNVDQDGDRNNESNSESHGDIRTRIPSRGRSRPSPLRKQSKRWRRRRRRRTSSQLAR